MKTKHNIAYSTNNRLFRILIGALSLLLIPLTLQLTIGTGVDGQGFNWKLNDFLIVGVILGIAALLVELVLRNVQSKKSRMLFCALVFIAFILIYIDLAVGIFNIPGFSGS